MKHLALFALALGIFSLVLLLYYGFMGLIPITIIWDIFGLTLISWFLFSRPERLKLTFDKPFGILTDQSYQEIVDEIIENLRNHPAIKRMRIGFGVLVASFLLKLFFWFYSFHTIQTKI